MIRDELQIGKFDPREIGFNKLSNDDQLLIKEIEKNNRVGFDEFRVTEFLKCRQNPFYFIHNYIYLSEVGGGLLYTSEMMNPKAKRVIKSLHKYHKCIFMASRQLGKMLDLDTPIPLPNGEWKTLSDIHPGDYVLDNYNLPTKVLWESEIFYDKLCYELEFDCGEKIIAGEDHLWRISSITKQDEVIDTKTIYELNDKSIYVFRNYDYKKFYIKNIIPIAPVPCKCIAVDNEDKLFLCGKSMIPTHNSTLMAAMLVWALTFYPGNKGIILNMDMAAGIENINKIKFMLEHLPSWLKFIPKRASQHKTRVELSNDSAISVVYPLKWGHYN